MTTPVKLNKAQREFFNAFAFNAVSGLLVAVHEMNGSEATQEELIGQVQDTDLTALTNLIAKEFTDRVEFKTLVKVDKFLKTEEALSVITASTEVSHAINTQLIEVIASLIPTPDAE